MFTILIARRLSGHVERREQRLPDDARPLPKRMAIATTRAWNRRHLSRSRPGPVRRESRSARLPRRIGDPSGMPDRSSRAGARPLRQRGYRPRRLPIGQRAEPAVAVLGALLVVVLLAGAVLPVGDLPRLGGLLGAGPPRDAERARVVDVVDGDTLVVDLGRHVRLLGLDTPETVHPDHDGPQPFGAEASARLSALVDGRTVALESDVTDADHFGRALRHVWIGRHLAAEILLREGLGYALTIPPNTRHADRLRAAERAARDAGRGVWSIPRPDSPDIFSTPWAASPTTHRGSR